MLPREIPLFSRRILFVALIAVARRCFRRIAHIFEFATRRNNIISEGKIRTLTLIRIRSRLSTAIRYVKLVPMVTHAKSLAPLRAETSKNNESAGVRPPLGHASRRFPAGVHPFLSASRYRATRSERSRKVKRALFRM